VNSPGSAAGCVAAPIGDAGVGVFAAAGGTPCTGGGATGLWNMRVNSPGSAGGGAVVPAATGDRWDRRSVSVVCRLPATGATPGTGDGGATGLWNIRVNSPGSDDAGAAGRVAGVDGVDCVLPAATGGTPGTGGGGGVDCVLPAATGDTPGNADGMD
jgi:hypothetical protein